MVHSSSMPNIALKLISERLMETETSGRNYFTNLLLVPGESSEMLIQLENTGKNSLEYRLEISGDFPADWCSLSSEAGTHIIPGEPAHHKIRFYTPKDYFENQFAIAKNQPKIKLEYEGQVKVFVTNDGEEQLVGYQTFMIFVRAPSGYLNYLPTFLQENDFLGRFLSICEQTVDPVVQAEANLWAYFDPLTAPEAMLPFLAHWVAWEMDDSIDIKQQRLLLRNATTLYRWHGTRYGLRFYLHLCTGLPLDEDLPESKKHISIEEIFSDGFVIGSTKIAHDSMIGGGKQYHFTVTLRPDSPQSIDEAAIRKIIEREKPTFCSYELHIIYPDI